MKNISILGSTGSIGTSTLKVIDSNPDKYRVVALAAGRNRNLLLEQIERFHPLAASIIDEKNAEILRGQLGNHSETEVLSGSEGFECVATLNEADTVVSAMTGAAGLMPTYAAIKAGKNIALANKETMVMAGALVMEEAEKQNIAILPVDSEHSAVLQSLQGHQRDDLKRVILTASGGPFREYSRDRMKTVTAEQALRHPTWNMGNKITIDSATLMNKGLEVIEAKWLFDLAIEEIGILIHPQSIIHSMVEYRDGSIIAQLGVPDMITPISYALSFPHHIETTLPPLKLHEVGILSFMEPDLEKFKCLDLALRATEIGGSMPAVLNGANEIAVDLFLKGEIAYLQISQLIEKTMEAHASVSFNAIEEVAEADLWARKTAKRISKDLKN